MADDRPLPIRTEQRAGKRLEGAVRGHRIVTDRPPNEGGDDAGPTSGELLLLSIGSCAAGALRNYLNAAGIATQRVAVEVGFEPNPVHERRDRIRIRACVPPEAMHLGAAALREAALSGGVTSRMRAGSEVEVDIAPGSAQVAIDGKATT